jgi:hypothetical protein
LTPKRVCAGVEPARWLGEAGGVTRPEHSQSVPGIVEAVHRASNTVPFGVAREDP